MSAASVTTPQIPVKIGMEEVTGRKYCNTMKRRGITSPPGII